MNESCIDFVSFRVLRLFRGYRPRLKNAQNSPHFSRANEKKLCHIFLYSNYFRDLSRRALSPEDDPADKVNRAAGTPAARIRIFEGVNYWRSVELSPPENFFRACADCHNLCEPIHGEDTIFFEL